MRAQRCRFSSYGKLVALEGLASKKCNIQCARADTGNEDNPGHELMVHVGVSVGAPDHAQPRALASPAALYTLWTIHLAVGTRHRRHKASKRMPRSLISPSRLDHAFVDDCSAHAPWRRPCARKFRSTSGAHDSPEFFRCSTAIMMSVNYRQPEDDLEYLLAAEDAQSDDDTDVLGAPCTMCLHACRKHALRRRHHCSCPQMRS